MGPCCLCFLAEVSKPVQHPRSHGGRRVSGGNRRQSALLQAPPDEDQPVTSLGGTVLPWRHVSLRVHHRGLHRGPCQQEPDHLHLEPQPHNTHVGWRALRFQGLSGAAGNHTTETGGVDILRHLWLLQTYSGVWFGSLQEQPGEGHEGAGIRAVQPTGRDAPAAAQGHSEGCIREGQRGSKDSGFSCCRPTEASAVRLTGLTQALHRKSEQCLLIISIVLLGSPCLLQSVFFWSTNQPLWNYLDCWTSLLSVFFISLNLRSWAFVWNLLPFRPAVSGPLIYILEIYCTVMIFFWSLYKLLFLFVVHFLHNDEKSGAVTGLL